MGGRAVPDYGNFFNAIAKHPKPPPKPSHVTFDVRWHGGGDHQHVDDSTFGFSGDFVDGPASISFTAKNDGSSVVYRSLAAKQTVKYAGAGNERNGVFYG